MIPRIGQGSESITDCVHYHAHDRAKIGLASTSERVAWVVSRNLPIDPERGDHRQQIENMQKCAKVMQWTAEHQSDIKRAAGGSLAGRRLIKRGYSYSLSWAKDEHPNKHEMLQAADETLKLLKMQEHQALIVCHNDTEHPHVHVIVNRVHPGHGRAVSLSCDRLKLSKWAQDYEEKRGRVLVPQRVVNNKQRRTNQLTFNRLRSKGDSNKIVKAFNLTREERARLAAYGDKSDLRIRNERAAAQRSERDTLEARWNRRESLLDAEIKRIYGESRQRLDDDLKKINERISAKGFFRQAVRRLTGAQRHDMAQRELVQKTIDNLEWRITERKKLVLDTIAHERHRLSVRHDHEKDRDEEFIIMRQRRIEREEQGSLGSLPSLKPDCEKRQRTRKTAKQRREARERDHIEKLTQEQAGVEQVEKTRTRKRKRTRRRG